MIVLGSIMALIGGAFWFGQKRAAKKEQLRQEYRNSQTHAKAKEAQNEVDALDDAAVDQRLRDRANR